MLLSLSNVCADNTFHAYVAEQKKPAFIIKVLCYLQSEKI